MTAPFATRELDIDPQNRTPIMAPFGCNNVSVRNTLGVDINIKTEFTQPDQRISGYYKKNPDSI
jgi:hypothetical protein